MAGKYANVLKTLPKLLGDNPSYQIKVNAVKDEVKADPDYRQHASYLAWRYAELRAEIDDKEAGVSELRMELEAISQLLQDQYEAEGTTLLRLDSGASVAVQPEPYAQVVDKDAFRRWAIANGYEESLALPWQTTNSITKERLLAGEACPAGVTAFVKNKLVLRKG